MRDMNALNVYQSNIFHVLKVMYKAIDNLNQRVFNNTFIEIHHRYPSNFKHPKIITKAIIFVIFSSKSNIWNNYVYKFEKIVLLLPLFLNKLKNKLLESKDELAFL